MSEEGSGMISWLFKTAVGRIVGAGVGGMLLSGILYAGCQVKGCIEPKAKVEAKTAQKTLEVEHEDQKVKEQVTRSTGWTILPKLWPAG